MAAFHNLKTLCSEMSTDLEHLVTWFNANKLFLNISR